MWECSETVAPATFVSTESFAFKARLPASRVGHAMREIQASLRERRLVQPLGPTTIIGRRGGCATARDASAAVALPQQCGPAAGPPTAAALNPGRAPSTCCWRRARLAA